MPLYYVYYLKMQKNDRQYIKCLSIPKIYHSQLEKYHEFNRMYVNKMAMFILNTREYMDKLRGGQGFEQLDKLKRSITFSKYNKGVYDYILNPNGKQGN